jgi:Mg-chelatase subunit ChlD
VRRALPDTAAAVGTILLAVSAWLFWPRERVASASTLPPLRIVLVDTSASAVWRHRNWSEWVEQAIRAQRDDAARAGEEISVVLFGDEVRRLGDSGAALPPPFISAGVRHAWLRAGQASRLYGALEVASELAEDPGRGTVRVVLVGDGTYTGADPRPALNRLAEAGLVLERLDLPPSDLEEVVPGALDLPDEVEVGAPIATSFDVFYAPGPGPPKSSVTLSIENQFFATGSIDVPVPSGLVPDEDGYLRWHVRVDGRDAREGLNLISVRGQRPFLGGNDVDLGITSQGVVRGAGERLVALVAPGPGAFLDRSTWIPPIPADSGLELGWISPAELSAGLERFDAVVTFDLPSRDLPVPILRSFVERGGGWLVMIGSESLSSFVAGTAVDLLPLVPPEDDPEARDVIFVVDRSGSMVGERSENVRRAVFALMDEALPADTVELRWFSDKLSSAIHLIGPGESKRPADREEARRLAADRVFATEIGGGPTALLRSLGELAEARAKVGREALVFLLSDGRDNTDPDPAATAPLVLDRLRAARVKLVVIAAGKEADRELLARLVGTGQKLEEVASLLDLGTGSDLRGLFRRELNRDRVREGPALRILPAGTPTGPGAEILRAMGPDRTLDWPTIRSYVRAKGAPGADVLWVSETGDPLLAVQRVGLGLTAACAFSLARQATPSSAMGERLAPLLRALARGKRDDRPSVRVEGDDLIVQGLPEDTPADLEARVFGADAGESDPPRIVIDLGPQIEGGDPRRLRRGSWPASAEWLSMLWDESGASALAPRVEIRARGSSASKWTPIQLALAPPRAVEFVLPRPRIPPFETVAAYRSDSRSPRPAPHPSAPWVLLSGMVLLTGAGLAGSFSRRFR